MVRFKKISITIAMVFVWGWTVFMVVWTTRIRGRVALLIIGILINMVLAFWYNYPGKKGKTRLPMETISEETRLIREVVLY